MNDATVVIDHLIVDAAATGPALGVSFGALVGAGLERLLRERGLPPGIGAGAVAELVAPAITTAGNESPSQLASAVALAVYGTLAGQTMGSISDVPGARG
jgi:hypothetical protein